jgi:tryptophan 2,3-dioxygenase
MATRSLEPGIRTDLRDTMSYGGYLELERLLGAQVPRSRGGDGAPLHDELLFIIQHQVSELWMKLAIHEIRAAIERVKATACRSFKILARVKAVQRQLFEQWAVLETLTPSEYEAIRPALGSSSGFQSAQYRALEFLLGNKHADMIDVFRHDPAAQAMLTELCTRRRSTTSSCGHLARRGLPCRPSASSGTGRNLRAPSGLVPVLRTIYADPRRWWDAYDMCEKLVDIEESFQLWRFRHLKTVERIIGHRPGTGGSSGVGFLTRALDVRFFPELIDVRGEPLGNVAPSPRES